MQQPIIKINDLIKLFLVIAIIAAAWVGKIEIIAAVATIIFIMILF